MNAHAPAASQGGNAARVQPTFVLLFAMTPAADGAAPAMPTGLQPIPDEVAAGHRERIDERQQRLLGEPYLQARRLRRRSIGRLPLPDARPATDPAWADIHLVWHRAEHEVCVLTSRPSPRAMRSVHATCRLTAVAGERP